MANLHTMVFQRDLCLFDSKEKEVSRLSKEHITYAVIGFHGGGGPQSFFFDLVKEDKRLGVSTISKLFNVVLSFE